MQLTDILGQMGGLQSVARDLGITESQATTGAAALIPAILGGFKNKAQAHPQGVDGLGGLLGQLGGGGLLDSVLGSQPTDTSSGNAVLGQIFGSKDVSRAVAQNAASTSGLDPALLKKMLPIVAMLVAGYMAKRQNSAGSSAGGLGGLAGMGGLGGLLGGLLGGQGSAGGTASAASLPGLASMLDMDGNGNPLDDIMRMMGGGGR